MKLVSKLLNGTIIKVVEEFFVSHNFIDPYSQIPCKLPIHSLVITSELTINEEVYFNIVLENDTYFALLKNK